MATIEIPEPIMHASGKRATWMYNPAAMLYDLGFNPDPWQVQFLNSKHHRTLLNCSRQSGKTTAAAFLCLYQGMFQPNQTILIFASASRQSKEFLHRMHSFYRQLGHPVQRQTDQVAVLDFDNGSRIIPLPDSQEGVRIYSPNLIIVDEAAQVSDALYNSIMPMLAANKGSFIGLSTPFGKRGWYYHEWIGEGRTDWRRFSITADDCPRIDPAEVDQLRHRGESYIRQEFYCDFSQVEGLVYPNLAATAIDRPDDLRGGRFYGGVDWGYHNPAAGLVGWLTRDDVLIVLEEVYGPRMTNEDLTRRMAPLADQYQIQMIYADPAEPGSIEMFRRNNLPCREAMNRILPGVQAVTARINSGRLKVVRSCLNLIKEAGLYRYPTPEEKKIPNENPLDQDNHALAALRYMVCGIDRVRELHARAPQVLKDERREIPIDHGPDGDYRKPTEQNRYSSIEHQRDTEWDNSEEARRMNREHLETEGWQ
jgi:hypothetical protein